jgi:hypothetical protein
MNLFFSIVLIVNNQDKMHLRAVAELDIVLETLLEEHRNPVSQIPMEEIEESAIQTINLLAIQKTCALGATQYV